MIADIDQIHQYHDIPIRGIFKPAFGSWRREMIERPYKPGQKLRISSPIKFMNGTEALIVVVVSDDGKDIVVSDGGEEIRVKSITGAAHFVQNRVVIKHSASAGKPAYEPIE